MPWLSVIFAFCSVVLCVHARETPGFTAGSPSRLRHIHINLDSQPHFHVNRHAKGQAALGWLSDANKVITHPAIPPGQWPENIVIGYSGGYDYEVLKPLIYGFLANVPEPAILVLLSPSAHIHNLPNNISRVVVQQHAMPEHLAPEDLPYPVSLRFYVTVALLHLIQHQGFVFFLDTRDVFIQRDPFAGHSDGVLHFPRESSSYRLKGPYTDNRDWLLKCYGEETLSAVGGNYVLNSGTLLGPSWMLKKYFELMLHEFENRWHCMRLHGSDQAVHNYLVYTGKLIGTGIEFQIDDQITGGFAFVAYTHPNVWDFRYLNDEREELYNREGKPLVAIHLWPGENRVAKKVVLPFVAAYEQSLRGSPEPPNTPEVSYSSA